MQHGTEEEKNQSFKRYLLRKIDRTIVPIFLVVSATISLCLLVVGSLNIRHCPINICIPVFLIVIGALGLVSKIISFVRKKNIVNVSKFVYVKWLETALYFVEVVFLFLGTYWVFREFEPNYSPVGKNKYCDKTTYMLAFVYLTVHYTLLIFAIFGLLGLMCCMATSGYSVTSYSVEAPPAAGAETTERLTLREDENRVIS